MQSSFLLMAEMKSGEQATLHEIHADRGVKCRLSSLGFTPGVTVEMSQNYGFGPLVVIVRGTRVALGRQEARGATVRRSA